MPPVVFCRREKISSSRGERAWGAECGGRGASGGKKKQQKEGRKAAHRFLPFPARFFSVFLFPPVFWSGVMLNRLARSVCGDSDYPCAMRFWLGFIVDWIARARRLPFSATGVTERCDVTRRATARPFALSRKSRDGAGRLRCA
jgi:hypothetical protein